jgi:2-C-methyl-D-erythritol 4-phosphate cytidylyltransferase/2-C-methyl-D-erythritol 2,4-cyclodiphosphate synthase
MPGIDKMLVPIGGRPLLAWTLQRVAAAPEVERTIVVTAAESVDAIRRASWLPASVVAVIAGGDRRQASVAAGFHALEVLDAERRDDPATGARVVLVHDGARPAVPTSLVSEVIRIAASEGAAIPVLSIADTVKRISNGRIAETLDRTALATAQTPQGVRRDILRVAYEQIRSDCPEEFTDEAALLEACRIPVQTVPGDPANLKVTVPADLPRAAAALALPEARIGMGFDSHPFGPAPSLVLGGLTFAAAPGLHGHSDGDVALHALADALLGAGALGDLGRLFPADHRTPRGIDSRELLREVLAELQRAGYRPASADLTIVGARPRLGDHLVQMRSHIAELLGVDLSRVNVKASSGNLAGDEGAGRAISAQALVSIEGIQ